MSKAHHKSGSRKHTARAPAPRAGAPDGAVYIGVVMIAAFAIWMWTIVANEPALLVCAVIVLALVNLYTWRVYFGARLAPWKQSLARLTLRWVGYGTRKGRPLEAAHGSRPAKIMLILTLVTSVVVIVALAGPGLAVVQEVTRWCPFDSSVCHLTRPSRSTSPNRPRAWICTRPWKSRS
jgi:hypothetical protein